MRATGFLRRGRPRPFLMGVLNVTPDSFSDGGRWNSPDRALAHADELISQGAEIIDIGAESTRPGAEPVPADEELRRLIPMLKEVIPSIEVPVSVDTYKAEVAEAAVGNGVSIINDVGGLRWNMAEVAARLDVPIVLMSSYGTPRTFKKEFIPGDGVEYMRSELMRIIDLAHEAGIRDENIISDPGVGFGTAPEQGMEIMRRSSEFSFGKYPVLIGPSRKRFLTKFYPDMDIDAATAEACVLAANNGADIVRVHNVAATAARF